MKWEVWYVLEILLEHLVFSGIVIYKFCYFESPSWTVTVIVNTNILSALPLCNVQFGLENDLKCSQSTQIVSSIHILLYSY